MSSVAFVASSGAAPQQYVVPLALRGTAQTFAAQRPTEAAGSSSSYSTLAAAAAGFTAFFSFAGQSKARAGQVKRAAEEAAPPPPSFDKTKQIGAMDPVGFFDPAGFCKDEASFKDLRAKELKHGRAAMMGAVGMLGQSLFQLPGMEGVPTDVSAAWTGNGAIGMAITFVIVGALEATVFVQDDKKEPGNFGNPLPLVGNDYSDEMRSKELNNGRIAMFAAIGQIFAGLYTGKAGLAQFGL